MREADKTIETLLAALRDAEPSSGMERRILDGLRARESTFAPSSGQREGRSRWLPRFAVTSLVAATVLAASFFVPVVVRHPSRLPAEDDGHPASGHWSANVPASSAQKLVSAPRRAAVPMSAQHVRRPGASSMRAPVAASYPAPTAPLTEQEKLLLRVAHRMDAGNTPILNPELEAAQSTKAIEQFQQFFEISEKEMRSEIE